MEPASLTEKMLFNTVRIVSHRQRGDFVATGFILVLETDTTDIVPLLVSNRHVFADTTGVTLEFHRADDTGRWLPGGGMTRNIRFDGDDVWTGHPDDHIDVAVLPLAEVFDDFAAKELTHYYSTFPLSAFADEVKLQALDAVEEVLFIGYPDGIADEKNLLPITRRATTASHASIDYLGSPSFLIDGSVFPGSSGSPVFLFDSGSRRSKGGGLVVGSRFLFLGVLAAGYFREVEGELQLATADLLTEESLDLGIVFKSSTVLDTVDAFLQARGQGREGDTVLGG